MMSCTYQSLVVIAAVGGDPCRCQSGMVACDINTQSSGPMSSTPRSSAQVGNVVTTEQMVYCNKALYFTAYDVEHGRELWKTDGTAAGTVLVKDIRNGPASSEPKNLVCCASTIGDVLFFAAYDDGTGYELWRSDGTAAGTVLVRDIVVGPLDSRPTDLECMNGVVYFDAVGGLWCSDGTAGGTRLLKSLSNPSYLRYNPTTREVYFSAGDSTYGIELWKTNGTASGTIMVRDIHVGGNSSPSWLVNFGARTLFVATTASAGAELWVTDGTSAGTVLVKDIRPGTAGSDIVLYESTVCNGVLYFRANDLVSGHELWRTDGTGAGTLLAANIDGTSASSSPSLHLNGSTLYLAATTSAVGRELWRYDCVTAAVSLVKDLNPGTASSNPGGFADFGGRVLVRATAAATGAELYVTDGTSLGTLLVKDVHAGTPSSSPEAGTFVSANQALFVATSGGEGRELWTTDGTEPGTRLLKDIAPGVSTQSADPMHATCSGGKTVFLSADAGDGRFGREPYVFTESSGCMLLMDVLPGPGSSDPSQFTTCWTRGRVVTFFTASNGSSGTELWVTDGSPQGTVLLKDIWPGSGSSAPQNLRCAADRLFFTAQDGISGTELWTSDGTATGTVMVKDIRPGALGSNPSWLTLCRGRLFFAANDGLSGGELWSSDGTPSGTAMVHDIYSGATGSTPTDIVCCPLATSPTILCFAAASAGLGRELWMSDGTAAGTTLVADLEPGGGSSSPAGLAAGDGKVYFAATTAGAGSEPWTSDGTLAGTLLLRDIRAGSTGSSPTQFTWCSGRLLFVAGSEDASQSPLGIELWVSNGTPSGTSLVADIYPGAGSSSPAGLVCTGSRVLFAATTASHGVELWSSDGSPAGTLLIRDILGDGDALPEAIRGCCCRAYFVATDPQLGRELHFLREPGATVEGLGVGCAPSFPTLHATPPILGRTCILGGDWAPLGRVGVLLLGAKGRDSYTISNGCSAYIDLLAPWLFLAAVAPPRWEYRLAIPSDAALLDACVTTQTWWVHPATILPVVTTNALILGVGM